MDIKEKFIEEIKKDEGIVLEIYLDHLGNPTLGVGHLITEDDPEYGQEIGTPVSEERVWEAFEKDVEISFDDCTILFHNFQTLHEEAQLILLNMCFNMGRPKLSKFKNMRMAISKYNYDVAADEMVDSLWYTQIPNRPKRLVERMRNIKTA